MFVFVCSITAFNFRQLIQYSCIISAQLGSKTNHAGAILFQSALPKYNHFKLAFVHKTYPGTAFCMHVPPFCFKTNSRKTRSIAWESTQLSTWVKFRRYDWLSPNPLGTMDLAGDLKITLEG